LDLSASVPPLVRGLHYDVVGSYMRTSLVLTVICDDKPGIVERLSTLVLAADANWEESRMARLAGQFAGLLRVSVDIQRADALAASLTTLEAEGLKVVVARSADAGATAFRTCSLNLVGNDQPGIIRDISRVLAQHRVNIEELETEVTSAPMSGEPLFRAHARLRTPSTMSVDDLRGVLESLAGDLMVEVTLEDG
jgi:glycine cleavage system regulatory protein